MPHKSGLRINLWGQIRTSMWVLSILALCPEETEDCQRQSEALGLEMPWHTLWALEIAFLKTQIRSFFSTAYGLCVLWRKHAMPTLIKWCYSSLSWYWEAFWGVELNWLHWLTPGPARYTHLLLSPVIFLPQLPQLFPLVIFSLSLPHCRYYCRHLLQSLPFHLVGLGWISTQHDFLLSSDP